MLVIVTASLNRIQVSPLAVCRFVKKRKVYIPILHWHAPDVKKGAKHYEYSVVRVTIAVCALQPKKFAQKSPEPLAASLRPQNANIHPRKRDNTPAGAWRI